MSSTLSTGRWFANATQLNAEAELVMHTVAGREGAMVLRPACMWFGSLGFRYLK